MPNSQYDSTLTFSETQCVVSFLSKSADVAGTGGHVLLVIEGINMAETDPRDTVTFDYLSENGAIDRRRIEAGVTSGVRSALIDLGTEIASPDNVNRMIVAATTAIASGAAAAAIAAPLLSVPPALAALPEGVKNKIFKLVENAVVSCSATSSGVLFDIIGSKGRIRSSHPLIFGAAAAQENLNYISVFESTKYFGNDDSFSWIVPRQEVMNAIGRIKGEQPRPPPFKMAGNSITLGGWWVGTNCLDWALFQLERIPQCAQSLQVARVQGYGFWGTVMTPKAVLRSFRTLAGVRV